MTSGSSGQVEKFQEKSKELHMLLSQAGDRVISCLS
jgi:hypothetical protein